ncbi:MULTISPECIES: phage head-tail joining protein [Brucella]|uniref:Uncharacterized protein n=2 Tax=Brucella TaxID=234 RepID=A6WZU8_BRUA4|nr:MULTISPECIES: hypothetical protein [Brucella]ABS14502.1 conserved hypothetical protein [Brucella anthropi ATCC 49188]AIK45052.1 hypothetical protein DR92_1271 [Brucella anthropi]KAB0571912.1 hypothetical protein F7Q93_09795 [Brucella pituitosa]KAB2739374.1 hypothetical protein F9K90_06375 [Brucella anthropi]KAB2753514.1 hypothetical protein F9K95_06715 [Brucella anthropi]
MNVTEMQQQLANLRALRAEGVRKTRFGDDETEYRSDAELAAAIADLETRIATALKPSRRLIYPRVSKGY